MEKDPTPATDNEGKTSPTETETEVTSPDEKMIPFSEYQKLQRKLARAQRTADTRIGGEEAASRVALLDEKVDAILEVLKGSAGDEKLSEAMSAHLEKGKTVRARVQQETAALKEISALEIEHDADFNEDRVAVAYWESGNYAKALETFTKGLADDPADGGKTPSSKISVDTKRSSLPSPTPAQKERAVIDEAYSKGDTRTLSTLLLKKIQEKEAEG